MTDIDLKQMIYEELKDSLPDFDVRIPKKPINAIDVKRLIKYNDIGIDFTIFLCHNNIEIYTYYVTISKNELTTNQIWSVYYEDPQLINKIVKIITNNSDEPTFTQLKEIEIKQLTDHKQWFAKLMHRVVEINQRQKKK